LAALLLSFRVEVRTREGTPLARRGGAYFFAWVVE
jgi:hypothetical protein